MSSNQRENRRKEQKREKDKKTRRIIWIIIALIVIALFVMKFLELDFSNLKSRFTHGNGSISLSDTVTDNNNSFTLDSSKNVIVNAQGSKLSVLTELSLTVLNTSSFGAGFNENHGYLNPVLATSDSYSLLFDQGAYKLRLDSFKENIYEKTSENSILCADVADNGNIVYATTSDNSKSEIYIYSKTLDEKLFYGITYGYVTNVAIDSSGKKIVFAVVNSEDSKLKTMIYIMHVGDTEPRETFEITESPILELRYCKRDIYVIGADFISVLSNGKSLEEVFKTESIHTIAYDFTPSDELVLVYNEYSNSTDNKLVYVKPSSKIKTTIDITGAVKDVAASSKTVSVLLNDKIVSYKLSSAEEQGVIPCDETVTSITHMSSKIFIHHGSLIERIGS